ncbi:ArsR/SmtB family transcription factor [Mesorhizobium xinjiangense]|uniref:ArsR/SmtB family transcription factor n=1 Tax=Mesorhizobium xinjiangense TaxID=2678685 RepID=UPI0012ED61FE|nr:helix-turn-helix domain-containing protein [Mesorhizobium xinjiangense]
MALWHPELDQIELSSVLNALGDPTRLAIVGYLASHEGSGMACGEFCDLGSKTGLSYHFSRLREAGIIRVEPSGTRRLVTLRRDALDRRFPGLIDSVLVTAPYGRQEPRERNAAVLHLAPVGGTGR